MRGLLSPTSRTNCENMSPSSPSSKLFSSPSLSDSWNSLNYSCLMQSQTKTTKFYSFKKIKEQRIKQKNEQGKVVKQMILRDSKNHQKRQRLKTLDDAKTIQSRNSHRSSISVGKRLVDESIIIMRGQDLEKLTKEQQEDFNSDFQPQTPSFKRRNTFNQDKNIKTDFLKPISINPCLVKSIQSGLVLHYQITKFPASAYSRLMSIRHEGILSIYSAISLKSCVSHLSLVIYQPYTETLSENLLKLQIVNFKQLLGYMIDIIKILSHLKSVCIYPEIQPTTVLLSHSNIKIKLRHDTEQQTQRQALRECGYYFSSLIKNLSSFCATPSTSRLGRKISGLTIGKRIEFDNLMEEFIRFQDYSLDEAYLKLQAIQL